MQPLQDYQPPENPTCGVVVSKNDEGEVICGQPGSHAVFMVDPETKSQVTAILVVCDKHDQDMDAGKELIFISDDGKDHILVQPKKEE